MSEIPDSVMKMARKYAICEDALIATANAILAERNACAKIADEYKERAMAANPSAQIAAAAAISIASAIRRR